MVHKKTVKYLTIRMNGKYFFGFKLIFFL